jgi:predicted MFS family arabinose efflux permease
MTADTKRFASDFNKLWFGQTVSVLGDKVSRIALPTVAILALHAGAFEVGALAALGAAPFLFLSPFAGVWVDRMARRDVLIAADFGRLITVGSVPVAYLFDALTLTQLYVVSLLTGVLTVFFQVAYHSYLPSIVDREQLISANGKLQTSTSVAEVGGSAAAGVLVQALGNALAIIIDALSFLVSVVSLAAIRHREPKPERRTDQPDRKVMRELREGITALLADGRLRSLMLGTGLVNLGAGLAQAILLVFLYQSAKLSPSQVGIAFAVAGIGLILGAVFAGKITKAIGVGTSMVGSVLLSGLAYVGIAAIGSGVTALIALSACQLVFGITQSVYHIQVMSLVQAITPPQLLGRVNGTAMTVVFGAGAVGAALGGVVGGTAGVRPAVLTGAVVVLLGALLLLFSPIRAIRTIPASEDEGVEPVAAPGGADEPQGADAPVAPVNGPTGPELVETPPTGR